MSDIVIKVENVSKQYRLGVVGTGTLSHDLNRWWHLARGKEDPYSRVGDVNHRDTKGDSEYVWAVKDISFELEKGEVLGIIGKNGAGKSTLLKILSRVTGPTTGSVKMKGRVGCLLEVGTGFHPELTGKENVYLNGAILGMTKKEISKKLDEIVEFSGVSRYIDTPVKRYSSGMKVRLGFAVAAHLDPEILVVDEVLAVGDFDFQKKCIGKMKEVSGEGRTVLFVSHNMESIQNLCTRTMLLENGAVSAIGETAEMIVKYTSETFDMIQKDSNNFFQNITRRGYGDVQFDDIQVINSEGKVNTFEVKEKSDVEFKMAIKYNKSHENVLCRIIIKSSKYDEVITGSELFLLDQTKADSNNILNTSIIFKELNLLPGTYRLYFWLGTDKVKGKFDILDKDIPPLIVKQKEGDGILTAKISGFFSSNCEHKY